MSEHIIKSIDNMSKEISQTISPIREDVRKSLTFLEKIVNFFSEILKSLEKGFSRVVNTQSELMIISKTTELASFSQLFNEQGEILNKKKDNLKEDLEKMSNRYLKMAKHLSENAEFNILKMDGHILHLNRDYYNEKIAQSFSKYSTPILNRAEKYYLDCSCVRNDSIDNTGINACKAITNFIEIRDKFVRNFSHYINDESINTAHVVPLPVQISANDKGLINTYLPGRASIRSNQLTLTENKVFDTIRENTQSKSTELDSKIQYAPLSLEDRECIKGHISQLFTDGYLEDTKWISLKKELLDFIDTTDIKFGEQING